MPLSGKKFLQNLLYTVGLYKTLIEKYFCSVQQSPKFERINKQPNQPIREPWSLLSVSVDKIKPYVNCSKGANDLPIHKTKFVKD